MQNACNELKILHFFLWVTASSLICL